MIRVLPSRYVITADQCLRRIRPTTSDLGSSVERAGTSTKSGSSQSSLAVSKSIPCFVELDSLLSGSNSSLMYNKYTIYESASQAKQGYSYFCGTSDGRFYVALRSDHASPRRTSQGSRIWGCVCHHCYHSHGCYETVLRSILVRADSSGTVSILSSLWKRASSSRSTAVRLM